MIPTPPKPDQLIQVLHGIQFDDTLDTMNQIIRFDYIREDPISVQICFDRKHKLNPSLSKPVGYFKMSSMNQAMDLSRQAMAVSMVLAFRSRVAIRVGEIEKSLDDMYSMIKSDIMRDIVTSLTALDRLVVEK